MERDEFKVHMLNETGIARAKQLAESFSNLLTVIEEMAKGSPRELALVRTKLQEASFWAKRAVACDPKNHQKQP